MLPIQIARRTVGCGAPLFVIAEIGLNHGGSRDHALALVEAAADAGASAIKLQTLRGRLLVAPHCPAPRHVPASTLVEFFGQFELDEAAHRAVVARARARGLAVMSTPFDLEAVDLLERVGVDAYKIASGDVTFHQLIARVARTGKPIVISTGMSNLVEVGDAVACARAHGAAALGLLHCVSAYPVPAGAENLRAISTLAAACGVPVGLSDHSTYPEAAIVAVALGASLYERHLVLGPASDSIDAAVSSTPAELAGIVAAAARASAALGTGAKGCAPAEAGNRDASRRGLYATRALPAGHVLGEEDVVALRPVTSMDARRWWELVGARLTQPIAAGAAFHAGALTRDAGENARRCPVGATVGEVRRAV
jgi:sialic acid synthase SpsE